MNQQPRRRTILSTTSSGTDNKGPFAFSCEELRALHTPKNAAKLRDIGGLEGLINGLLSHRTRGIGGYAPGDGRGGISVGNGHPTSHPEISLVRRIATFPISAVSSRGTNHSDPTRSSEMLPQRRLLFGDNSFPTNERKDSFFHIMWTFYNDPVLFFLTAAAAIALAIGLYQTFTSSHSIDNPPVEWVDGLTILVAVIIIVLVGSLNDWVKSRRLRKIEERGFEAQTTVIRRGTLAHIPSSEVVVGDIVQIQAGDIIPADGILVDGSRIACDESSITAESALVRKTPGDNASRTTTQASPELEPDPFMLSGTKVLEGLGTFIVTATGTHSIYGKAISSLRDHAELTPLQARLTVLTKQLAWMGSIISFILFASLFIKFAARLPHDDRSSVDKGKNFVDIVIIALSVLVIAAPEGIPLALALSLAQGTGSMLRKNVLVRHLKVSETMGTATSVCFDKTGTLTRGSITVVAGTLGLTSLFDEPSSDPTVLISRFADGLSAELRKLALQSLVSCRNFHAGEGELEIAGFDADPALQAFARERLHMQGLDEEGLDEPIRQTVLHHAADSSLATIVKLEDSLYTHRVFIRGNAEVLLSKTTNVIENTSTSPLSTIQLTANGRQFLDSTLQQYNSEGLQIVAIAYRDLCLEEEEVADMSHCLGPEFLLRDLVLLAIFGLQDPLREEAKMTVSICQNASITVRMFTGDSVSAATTVARQSGILRTESSTTVMEGDTFRALSDADRTNILSSLRVLARCTAEDKQLLVDSLKEQGEIIAVVGDGLSDALALSSADVGIAMGGATGTEIARQASSVILMDGKLTGIIEAIMWGRAIKDSVKKYLLFQIIVTISSALAAFVSALMDSNEESVLTPVQLMWINLFQDALAALALATDPPSERVLERKPESRTSPIVDVAMWKTIIVQSLYQLAVTYALYFVGPIVFQAQTSLEILQCNTLVFNAYVWMQIFSLFNCRQYDNTINVFEGMSRNWLFIAVIISLAGVQTIIVFEGGLAFPATPISGPQWAISIAAGALTLLFGALTRCVPDQAIRGSVEVVKRWARCGRLPEVVWDRLPHNN